MILEIIVTVAVIIGMLILVGVPLESILLLLAMILIGLIVLSMALFSLFFFITDIALLFRRKASGVFLRITDTDRFEHAVYLADGKEYTCLFPAESFGRKRIYKPETEYFLLIPRSPKRHSAYDRHSLTTIAIGTFFSVMFTILLAAGTRYLLALMQNM